jgi:hypothetical protein
METKNTVFIRHTELEKPIDKLDTDQLYETIPKNYLDNPNSEYRKTMIEWRWRFLEINGKKFVEISSCKPNDTRKYINKQGKLVEKNVDKFFDKFVTKQCFYYTDN